MNKTYQAFFTLPAQDRKDAFDAAARRLDTLPGYVEKDFWVCFVLRALYHWRPAGHPGLLFKGGTCLSKAFGLIQRFSEDIDLVVRRDDLGFAGDRDPVCADGLSKRRRDLLFRELAAACSDYVLGDLKNLLAILIDETAEGGAVVPDEEDPDRQTLFIEYPSLYPNDDLAYVSPRVKVEAGARSALTPGLTCAIVPYVAGELQGWSLEVDAVGVVAPERTFWEKLLILHGAYCGYRDAKRLPADRNRVSRHYYDAAMIASTGTGRSALSDNALLDAVRDHNLIAFPRAWKRFEEAVPGSLRLVPQPELRAVIERDYRAMRDMILGDAPDFSWIMEQLRHTETAINQA